MESEDEWPKHWGDIQQSDAYESGELNVASLSMSMYMEFCDGLRAYGGTLYASIDLGRDTEGNRDKWYPFEMYVREVLHNEYNE